MTIRIEVPPDLFESMLLEIQVVWEKFIDDFADFILSESQRLLREGGEKFEASDTGELVGSGVVLKNDDTRVWEIGFAADHAPYVEYGTHPGHTPPFAKIYAWVQRQDFVLEPGNRKQQLKNITWAIINGIKKSGLRPRPFLRQAVQNALSQKQRILEQTLSSL